MRWLRALIMYIVVMGAGLVYASAALLFFWLPEKGRWWFVDSYCRFSLWAGSFVCGMNVVVEGKEHLPDSPCVIMIKHTTALETYGHVPFFPRTTWVLKRSILWVPIFGWAMYLVFRPIAINRRAGTSAVKQVIRQGKEKLRAGIWVTIFPEGTRVAPGETRKYGVSGAALAKEAGVPIIPMAHNAGDFWRRREFAKRPGTIRFCIGPPISAADRDPRETNQQVQEWIENKMRDISVHYK